MEKKISPAVVRRLPRYHTHLNELAEMGVMKVSSKELGEKMGLTASQVRQDFNCFGGFGQQGYGYNVDVLITSISSILKLDQVKTAIIIGIGNLGQAIMNNFVFAKSGFQLVGAFDTSESVIGTPVSGLTVQNITELEAFCRENTPDIAVLTLPQRFAKEMSERLCACGIKGIWNFTNIDLQLDISEIPVENVHFSESLMVLSYKL